MGKKHERAERLFIEDRYMIRSTRWTTITVFLKRFLFHGPRVKLSFIEGYHETEDEAMEAIKRLKRGEGTIGTPEDYPKHFEIICIPEVLENLAEKIHEICK